MQDITQKIVRIVLLVLITLFSALLVGSASLYYKDAAAPNYDIQFFVTSIILLVLLNAGYYLLRKLVYKDEDQTRLRKFFNLSFIIQLIWGVIDLLTLKSSSHKLEIAASVILICPFLVRVIFLRAKPVAET